jgi:hypothetical protein
MTAQIQEEEEESKQLGQGEKSDITVTFMCDTLLCLVV